MALKSVYMKLSFTPMLVSKIQLFIFSRFSYMFNYQKWLSKNKSIRMDVRVAKSQFVVLLYLKMNIIYEFTFQHVEITMAVAVLFFSVRGCDIFFDFLQRYKIL